MTKGIAGKEFIVQGFGAVGFWAAKFIHDDGGKICGIIEYNSAIYSKKGFNPSDVKRHF